MVGKIKGSPTTEKKKMKAGLNRVFLPARFGLAAKILASKPTVLDIPWKTTLNGIDCGVFLMRHMETYMGSLKEWRCGFSPEFNSKGELFGKQGRELDDLRRKYVAKILLCDINRSKHMVEAGVRRYLRLGEKYRRQLDGRAYKKILMRLNSL